MTTGTYVELQFALAMYALHVSFGKVSQNYSDVPLPRDVGGHVAWPDPTAAFLFDTGVENQVNTMFPRKGVVGVTPLP